ncbi:MAG: TonB-dependent receptor [candidate division Zixibacteria bacterium]|nr:TonB-dependent receptor [candidate division Zixibacteria bacterium]
MNRNYFRQTLTALLVALLLICASSPFAANSATGSITGKILDEKTSEPIIGVTVLLQGTKKGARTDLDGFYRISKIEPSAYILKITSIGYNELVIKNVVVNEDETSSLSFTMTSREYEMEGITVEAKAVQNTEASILKKRQKASSISDAISSEQISRSGSGNAAEAMSKVTGASIVGGKYVYIRGLGDRYSNTQLNGSPLPSPNPDNQSAPMDLIPSGILDNIVVEKTFTPDKPGNFAGGSVNLGTKDYPDRRSLKVSMSSGFNTNTNSKEEFISYDGGDRDWLAMDDGTREIPDFIKQNEDIQDNIPEQNFINVKADSMEYYQPIINYMDSASKTFNPQMEAHHTKPPINQGHSITYGDFFKLFDKPLGIISSLSYNRKYSSYIDGFNGKYKLSGAGSTRLTVDHEMDDNKSKEDVLWGGLVNFKYGIHPNHKIGVNYIYNKNGESVSRYMEGLSLEHLDSGQTMRTRSLSYSERELNSIQFSGQHNLFKSVRAEWQFTSSNTTQYEPDVRYFTDQVDPYQYEDDDTGDLIDTVDYSINPNRFPRPQRLWRDLDESNDEIKMDVLIPVNDNLKLKTGGSYLEKKRVHTEKRYEYTQYGRYSGNVDDYIANIGVDRIDTIVFNDNNPSTNDTIYQYLFTNYLLDASESRNQYSGTQEIAAVYSMFDFALSSKLKAIGGARFETTRMYSKTEDESYDAGEIDDDNILPSLNLVYAVNELMNLRVAYGKTLARPTLREMSPFSSEEFGVSRYLLGNIDLEYTTIDNYDIRWEWFVRPGEILAVSGFYKKFDNPIEMAIVGANGNIQPRNVSSGTVTGLEVEFRRHLDHAFDLLRNFSLGGNLTVVSSKVDIPEDEMVYIREYDPNAPATRSMYGQSPFIVNLDLGYANKGTSISVFYNMFGDRFAFNATNGTPDIYEKSRKSLDVLLKQKIVGDLTFKFSAKNLLADDVLFAHEDIGLEGGEEVYREYSTGRSFSIGMTYTVW